jgi:hypothetical protein
VGTFNEAALWKRPAGPEISSLTRGASNQSWTMLRGVVAACPPSPSLACTRTNRGSLTATGRRASWSLLWCPHEGQRPVGFRGVFYRVAVRAMSSN